jgi:hypothetical protein
MRGIRFWANRKSPSRRQRERKLSTGTWSYVVVTAVSDLSVLLSSCTVSPVSCHAIKWQNCTKHLPASTEFNGHVTCRPLPSLRSITLHVINQQQIGWRHNAVVSFLFIRIPLRHNFLHNCESCDIRFRHFNSSLFTKLKVHFHLKMIQRL